MEEPPAAVDRRIFTVMGIVVAVAVVITFTAGGAVLLARRAALEAGVARPTPGSAGAPTSLATDIELRSAPAGDTAIVTHLAAGTRVRVLGRSPDALWLVVGLEGGSSVVGWAPIATVTGAGDPQRLAVVADARSVARGGGTPSATFTPDLPDLRVERVLARQNRLVVIVVNDGPGDLTTPIMVTVNGGPLVRIETKSGEPLRARDRVEAALAGAYVQLRAPVLAQVTTQPADREEDTSNNTWEGIVEPDAPNDLEIVRAAFAGGRLAVTVRNNSPIPITGAIALTAREAPPGTTLLGRATQDVALDPGATVEVMLADVAAVDLTRITVRLSTEAITDAALANDVYPR